MLHARFIRFTPPQIGAGAWFTLCCAGTSVTWADDIPVAGTLDPLIITATRIPETASDSLSPVTVISRVDIERSQAQTLFDLFRGQPGFDVSSYGGPGQGMSVFLRGTNADHVLVLVDGIKIGSVSTGQAAFQDIPIELIDHIEIVRGPRSSLYGSEAIGGVIQIFTKKGSQTLTPTLSAGIGSYGTTQGSATLSGGLESGGWYSGGVSGFDTTGFPACRGTNANFAGCGVTPDPNVNDGYHNQSGRLRLGWHLDNGMDAEVNWLHTSGTSQYASSVPTAPYGAANYPMQTSQQVLSASLTWNPSSVWQTLWRVAQSQDNSSDFYNNTLNGQFDTTRNMVTWQNTLTLSPGQSLVAGMDYQADEINSATTAFALTSQSNLGLFLQYLGQFGPQDFQLSTRRDINQQFGTWTTGSAAWGYALTNRIKFSTSFGTAFRTPTFNDLYFPGYGNPNLRPETSNSFDMGFNGKKEMWDWSVHAYQTHINNLIEPYLNPSTFAYSALNIGEALIRGLETTYSTRLWGCDMKAVADLLSAVDQTPGATYGSALPRRAPQSGSLAFDRSFSALWSGGATLRAESARYDGLGNTYRMGGFMTADLRSEYRITSQWRLQGSIMNLFNKDYQTAYLYNQLGRGYYLTARYAP
ncbi:vitamin B12 transporter BtuB precursor [Ferrovum myxofaciens]|uniref:Vitamin B12 transporter BtuB n=1 Tax=Ferrovum myxofaciens TaxID=416213 RepID=A0A149VZP1_9PROT|nr:TonB-dependent receptor [Ferrovum myxofaciens]KXW58666.1 vitamin B12 transporter BtuB precursor [Ferrovum myxofaciens]